MPEPLLEPGLLVTDNCTACKGTGRLESGDTCGDCQGSGREVREIPLSSAFDMAQRAHERLVAPPPSILRREAIESEAGNED